MKNTISILKSNMIMDMVQRYRKCSVCSGRLVVCVLLFLPFILNAQEVVTLAECQEWARSNYPLIRQYSLIEKTTDYNLANAGKGWYPQLAISGKATYQSDVTKIPFDTEQISAIIPGFEIPTLSKDQYQFVGEINQPIWDGGAIRSARNQIRAQAAVNREQLESDLYALRERVNQVYFGALLQDELLSQNSLLQDELLINMERIRAMMVNGTANSSDMANMEVELLNARQQEIELNASRKAYRQMLGVLTGKDISASTLLLEPPLPSKPQTTEIRRPELNVFTANERLAEVQNERIKADLMPAIGLFIQGGYGKPGLNFLENRFKAYYVGGIRLNWNVGKLYTLKNDRRLVQTNRQAIGIQRDVFLFNTSLELTQQDTEIEKMEELTRSDREIVRLRESIKEASAVKLENGIVSVTDHIREINAENMARQTAAIHHVQYLMAMYEYLYINPLAP